MDLRDLRKQLFFNSVAWNKACRTYNRYYGEPDDLIKAKFDAIRSLSPAPAFEDANCFTWYDFKRGYQIM